MHRGYSEEWKKSISNRERFFFFRPLSGIEYKARFERHAITAWFWHIHLGAEMAGIAPANWDSVCALFGFIYVKVPNEDEKIVIKWTERMWVSLLTSEILRSVTICLTQVCFLERNVCNWSTVYIDPETVPNPQPRTPPSHTHAPTHTLKRPPLS